MNFSRAVQNMCLGLGVVGGDCDLTAIEVVRIEEIASALHRRSQWAPPPDPMKLAPLAAVRLLRLRPGLPADVPAVFTADVALYRPLMDHRCDCLAASFALASSIVLQRDLPWTDVFRWRLAAELLVPAWSVRGRGFEPNVRAHPTAPDWLIDQAWARAVDDVANK